MTVGPGGDFIDSDMHLYTGFEFNCSGRLTALHFHSTKVGNMRFGVWKKTSDCTYTLMWTILTTVSNTGVHNIPINDPTALVEPGYTIAHVGENGTTVSTVSVTRGVGNFQAYIASNSTITSTDWTPGLSLSTLTSFDSGPVQIFPAIDFDMIQCEF